MDQIVVTATTGRELGTRPSKRLRAEGRLPAVVYGLGKEPVNLAVDYAELRDALKTTAGLNTILQLKVSGESETAIVRSVQRDPIKRLVTHVDFMRVDPNQAVKVKVPITLTGEATAVLNKGGMIEQNMFELEVEVSPLSIPTGIEADLSKLTLDDRIFVRDLNLPAGVTPVAALELAVVSPVVSRAAKMAAEEDELEAGGALSEDAEASAGDE